MMTSLLTLGEQSARYRTVPAAPCGSVTNADYRERRRRPRSSAPRREVSTSAAVSFIRSSKQHNSSRKPLFCVQDLGTVLSSIYPLTCRIIQAVDKGISITRKEIVRLTILTRIQSIDFNAYVKARNIVTYDM